MGQKQKRTNTDQHCIGISAFKYFDFVLVLRIIVQFHFENAGGMNKICGSTLKNFFFITYKVAECM